MDYKQERMDSKVTMDYETNICGSFNLMRFIRKASFPKVGNPKDVHVKWVAGAEHSSVAEGSRDQVLRMKT